MIHFLGGNLRGGAVRLGGRAAHGAVQHAQDELAQQHFVADAQGVEIIFHLDVGGVPFFQRASGKLTVGVGQNVRRVHGVLNGNIEHLTFNAQHPMDFRMTVNWAFDVEC